MNQLKVNQKQTIVTLHSQGWSVRRISRELGYDRETVSKYVRLEEAKPATPSPGSGEQTAVVVATGITETEAKPATPSTGSDPEAGMAGPAVIGVPDNRPLGATAVKVSLCENWRKEITAGWEQGLTAKRIHQDLVQEHGFAGRYQSVKRFVRKLAASASVPFRRMEFAPAEQVQVDFGTGAWIVDEKGSRRRPHLFRAVLSHSRKGYSEATYDQKTETFLRCLENAYRHFGGVPSTTTPDNLKAAVLHPDWYDPELNPKLAAFAAHYGTVILPTKPKMPRHKGRVERGVDFAQEALKGRTFGSLAAENTFLAEWEKKVADTRLHGTTRRQVGEHFLAVEKPALQPLPANIFPSFTEGRRRVHLDGHVEFDKAYYSVPPEYTGREVWVRGESRLIRVYTAQLEPIAVHARAEPGRASTTDAHIHPLKRRLMDRGTAYLLERCQGIGPCAGAWALAMFQHRGIEGIRVLQGLIGLARKAPAEQLDRAASKALQRAGWRLGELSVTSVIDGTVFKVIDGRRSEGGVIEVFEGNGRVDQKRVS